MILLAEDDDAPRDAIAQLLECESLQVSAFPSCDALRAAVDPTSAALLILDVQMQGTTGLELLERLCPRAGGPQVILMTGNPTADIRARASAAGALTVLEKPFRGDELVTLVANALASRAA